MTNPQPTSVNTMEEARHLLQKWALLWPYCQIVDPALWGDSAELQKSTADFLSKTNLEEAPSNSTCRLEAGASVGLMSPQCGSIPQPATSSPPSPEQGMRTCPRCENGFIKTYGNRGLISRLICPTCKGSGQIPIEEVKEQWAIPTKVKTIQDITSTSLVTETPPIPSNPVLRGMIPPIDDQPIPTSDNNFLTVPAPPSEGMGKSLEEIGEEVFKNVSFQFPHDTARQGAYRAVASAVSLRHQEEHQGIIASKDREIAKSRETVALQDLEISRLTLLANENTVLAAEREAENARKEGVISLTHSDAQRIVGLLGSNDNRAMIANMLKDLLARLTQKGQIS